MTRLLIPALAGLVWLCAATLALAGHEREATTLPHGFTCDQVRSFVNVHGRWKALAWAVEQGATLEQIRAARRCLAAKPAS